MAKVGFISLGCPKNLVDSERMLGLLQLDGYQLVSAPDGSYRFLNPSDRRISTLSSSGLLSKIEDRNGNALTITYAPGISDVVDGLGRSLHFTFTGSKLTRISEQTGRTILFFF